MPVRRTLLCAALAFTAVLAPAARAGVRPQVVDAIGDARVVGGSGTDIVSALFSTGRDRHHRPASLVVTVTYAGPVANDEYVTHVVDFRIAGCGEFYLEVFAGGTYGYADCAPTDQFTFPHATRGRTLVMTLPFATVPEGLRAGAVLTDLVAYTAPGEPAYGSEPNEYARLAGSTAAGDPDTLDASIDLATSALSYRIG